MCNECRQHPCHPSCPGYEPAAVGYCIECESLIIEGDTCYSINGDMYCEDCIAAFKTTAEREG